MKNKKMVLLAALVLTAVVGCMNSESLDGTWALDEENPEIKARDPGDHFNNMRVTFKNGNFERSVEIERYGRVVVHKGTYITNDGNLIQTITHRIPRGSGSLELQEEKEPLQYTNKYSVSGNKLTIYGSVPYLGNSISSVDPLEFIRDKKTLKLGDNRAPSKTEPVVKSSGKASAFPGRWRLIEGDGDAEKVELFKDGTGTADGNGITWKIENGRFHILHPYYTFSAYYNVKGSTITFTQDDGEVIKYQKQ